MGRQENPLFALYKQRNPLINHAFNNTTMHDPPVQLTKASFFIQIAFTVNHSDFLSMYIWHFLKFFLLILRPYEKFKW